MGVVARLGKITGINLAYFIPRGLLLGARFALVGLITLAISVIFARLAPKETYGQYQYVISLVSLLSVLSLPGLNTAALRAFSEGDERSVDKAVRWSFWASLLLTAVLVGYGLIRFFGDEPGLGLAIIVAGVAAPFFYAPNNWYVYYEGRLNFTSSAIRIVASNLLVLGALATALWLQAGLLWLITLYFGINAALNVYYYFEGRRTISRKVSKDRLSLGYALRCTVQKFATTTVESIQAIIISAVFGFANLAVFQVANSLIYAFIGLTGALSSTYFPLLLRYKKLNHGRILLLHLLLGLFFWVSYLIALKYLFTHLYGQSYEVSIAIAHSLGIVIIALPLRVYLTNYFTARDQNAQVVGASVAANLAAAVFLVVNRANEFFQVIVTYSYLVNFLFIGILAVFYLPVLRKQAAARLKPPQ